MPEINTKKVRDRRSLRFDSVTDVRRDLETLEVAHRAGTLRHTGNWSPAQILSHLAVFIEFAFEGYPASMPTPPWVIRVLLRLAKNKYIWRGFPAGVKIPGVPGGTVGQEEAPFAQSLDRLRRALDRLERTPPRVRNPIFGPLSHAEWTALHCRHAELHLSFLHAK
jgi:Protein of unknown function (DUF1569)